MISMFDIKSPKRFLKQLIIVELLLGLGLITVGSLFLINLYIYLYINHGFYAYNIASTIFRMILIITGICKIISFILLKKSNPLGLNFSMISLLLLASNFLYLCVFIFIIEFLNYLDSGIFFAGYFVITSTQFGLSSVVFLVSIYVFLTIFKNRGNLKQYI